MLASTAFLIIGILLLVFDGGSGKDSYDLGIPSTNADETTRLLISINDNIHAIKTLVFFVARLSGVTLILAAVVLFFESVF